MHLNAHLDLDLVALEAEDELTVLVELVAPELPTAEPRPEATVQVVLDRSGSMGGERLDAALDALAALVDRLAPSDRFGLVTFDSEVEIIVPAGPLADRAGVKHAIRSVGARGMTNLSAGLMRGLQEARRVAGPAGATLLMISDGHANDGVTEPDKLADLATRGHADGVTRAASAAGTEVGCGTVTGVGDPRWGSSRASRPPSPARCSTSPRRRGLPRPDGHDPESWGRDRERDAATFAGATL